MRLGDRLLLLTVPALASTVLRLLKISVRTETIGAANLTSLWEHNERSIISFWHDQLLLMVFGYPGKNAKLLISASKDGELLTRTMRFFNHETVRGSSSKGGRAAFKEMLSLGNTDADIVLTPDGPRGPRHELKDGVLQLAKLSGRPIVPMAFACSRGHRFGSWDRCLLPYPFSKGVYSFGKPLYYDKKEDIHVFREQLNAAMNLNQKQAEEKLKSYGLSAV